MGGTGIGAQMATLASGTITRRSPGTRAYNRLVTVDAEAMVDPTDVDVATLSRIASGDQAALGALYDRYGAMVFALARRVTGDDQAAEECTQDAFLAVWRSAASFDPARSRPSTWICTIARNRALDAVRASQRRPTPQDDVQPDGHEPDVANVAEAADTAVRVAEAMAKLPPTQFEVLQLAYFDDLSQSEVADHLGLPLGTVKSRMRLAMNRMRTVATELGLEAPT